MLRFIASYLLIDNDTAISSLKKDIRINEIYFALAKGLK
jgi:L-arabinose isomerase